MELYKSGTALPTLEITPQNPDNIMLLGAEAQQAIAEASQKISGILLRSDEKLDVSICNILDRVDRFQNLLVTKNTRTVVNWYSFSRTTIIREYHLLLAGFDEMVLGLQLQEAQLLKEISIIKQLQDQLYLAEMRLKEDILSGEKILDETASKRLHRSEEAPEAFSNRLSKKVEALRISHIVLQQTQAQLQMLQDAHGVMVDQIITAISTTIPLWKNQISLLLGFEKLSYEQSIQDKLLEIAKQSSKKIIKQKRLKKLLDLGRLTSTNNTLASSLTQLVSSAEKETEVRKDLEMALFQNKIRR